MGFYTRKTRPADKFTTAEVAFLITFADGGGGGGGTPATWYSEIPTGSVNGSNTSFTLTRTPFLHSLQLVINDSYQVPGSSSDPTVCDYRLSAATITMNTAPPTGAVLYALYQ